MKGRYPWILVGIAGCSSSQDPEGTQALTEALATAGQSARATELGLSLPHAGASPHRMRATAELVLETSPEKRWMVRIERTIDRGEERRFRVTDTRFFTDSVRPVKDHEDGREILYDGGRLAVRRAAAPWRERAAWKGEERELLASAYDAMPALLSAFGPYLTWRAGEGPPQVIGLEVEWREAALDTSVAPRPVEPARLAELRDYDATLAGWLGVTHRPTRVSGRLAFKSGTQEVVAGELELSGSAQVEGTEAQFVARAKLAPEALPEVGFQIPADAMPPTRRRTWRMIEDVLGDELSPRYRPPP
jgi:hypothetical protein